MVGGREDADHVAACNLPRSAPAGLCDVAIGFHPVPPRPEIGSRPHPSLSWPCVNEVEVGVGVCFLIPLFDGVDHRGHWQRDLVMNQAGGAAPNRVHSEAFRMPIAKDQPSRLGGIEEPFQAIC